MAWDDVVSADEAVGSTWEQLFDEMDEDPVLSEPESAVGAGITGAAKSLPQLGKFAGGMVLGRYGAAAEASHELQDIQRQHSTGQVTRLEEIGTQDGPLTDTARYAAYQLGAAVPSLAMSAVTGGVGGFAGGMMAKKLATNATAAQVKKGQLAGVLTGAAATSIPMSTGEIGAKIYQETGEMHAGQAMLGGIAAGSLDVIGPARALAGFGLGGVAKSATTGSAGRHIAREVAKTAGIEGATEAGQELIGQGAAEWANPSADHFEPMDLLNAGVAGAIGGSPMGAISGVSQVVAERRSWSDLPQEVRRTLPRIKQYDAHITSMAEKYGVDATLVRSVIAQESQGKRKAKSHAGAQGLMQLMPGTASDMGVTDAYDAAQNIEGGVKYLAIQLKRYRGDVSLALAAYNAGPGNVDKHGGIPPFEETQGYVKKVVSFYEALGGERVNPSSKPTHDSMTEDQTAPTPRGYQPTQDNGVGGVKVDDSWVPDEPDFVPYQDDGFDTDMPDYLEFERQQAAQAHNPSQPHNEDIIVPAPQNEPLTTPNQLPTPYQYEGELMPRHLGDLEAFEDQSVVIDQAANESAESALNALPEPTQAQKEAGNYKKGHLNMLGLPLTIENPKGSVRKGVDESGKPWESVMHAHYGYVKGSHGADGDQVDVFLGDQAANPQLPVHIVDQVDPKTGQFDEHKVMIGYPDEQSAREGYLANYDQGWQGIGGMTPMTVDAFKSWVKSKRTKQPVSELPEAPSQTDKVVNDDELLNGLMEPDSDVKTPQSNTFMPTHELPTGEQVVKHPEEDGVWIDQHGDEWEGEASVLSVGKADNQPVPSSPSVDHIEPQIESPNLLEPAAADAGAEAQVTDSTGLSTARAEINEDAQQPITDKEAINKQEAKPLTEAVSQQFSSGKKAVVLNGADKQAVGKALAAAGTVLVDKPGKLFLRKSLPEAKRIVFTDIAALARLKSAPKKLKAYADAGVELVFVDQDGTADKGLFEVVC